MLVLTRDEGESIKIDDDIIVRIISVRGRHVRIGIDAPQEVKILRTELEDRDNAKTK